MLANSLLTLLWTQHFLAGNFTTGTRRASTWTTSRTTRRPKRWRALGGRFGGGGRRTRPRRLRGRIGWIGRRLGRPRRRWWSQRRAQALAGATETGTAGTWTFQTARAARDAGCRWGRGQPCFSLFVSPFRLQVLFGFLASVSRCLGQGNRCHPEHQLLT